MPIRQEIEGVHFICSGNGSSFYGNRISEPLLEKRTVLRINVGGKVQVANLIYRIAPYYPTLAREAHIQGTAILGAIISPEETIEELRAISGHSLLIPAAMESVKKCH